LFCLRFVFSFFRVCVIRICLCLAENRYNGHMETQATPSTNGPQVTFFGAAQSVTGSMHLVEAANQRFLLDCGLHRGPREEARAINRHFAFDPTTIDAVVLSHAHVDHCGNLPNLVRQGFRGPIYCTPATRDLIALMLADAARIQEEDAAVAEVIGHRRAAARVPLYTRPDAAVTVDQCVTIPYGQVFDIGPGVQAQFHDAAHILGSAMVLLTIRHGGRTHRITFTGDVGRRGLPFLSEASPIPAADLVICESTYGGRLHEPMKRTAARMSDMVRRTVARGGKVLIPAFSLGRTQIVLHYLRRWMREGLLPRVPIFVDSPLAHEISAVYRRHAPELEAPGSEDAPVRYLTHHDESHAVSTAPEPCVIVASGGMCDGGRIIHHLRHHIDDPRSALVLVSYQAPHTLGHRLLERAPTVRFHGRRWNKWIEVVELNGFSGHADQQDFVALLSPALAETGRVRLVHGEVAQSEALAETLRQQGFRDVAVPERAETVAL
jgi:metallo-beta-lactamase family protein